LVGAVGAPTNQATNPHAPPSGKATTPNKKFSCLFVVKKVFYSKALILQPYMLYFISERTQEVIMSTATFSIRMDSQLKRELDAICNEFGMSTSVAINIFARAVVRERRIPFEIAATPKASEPQGAFQALREQAKKSGVAGLSLAEINAEISKARAEQ